MSKSFWDRIHDLQESINGGVEPLETVKLKTSTIKISLGMYLIQSTIIALILSITYSSLSAWLIPMSALLQVGWLWNRVTDYWKIVRGLSYSKLMNDEYDIEKTDSINPPTININTGPLLKKESINHPLQTSEELINTTEGSSELWHSTENV